MTSQLFGTPASTSAAEVVHACERLPGPFAMRVETHRNEKRKVRWFFVYGTEEAAVERVVSTLLESLPALIIAAGEDTTGFGHVRTLKKRGKKITSPKLVSDAGEIETIVSKHFSSGDAHAYVTGTALEYGESASGWAYYARLEDTGKLGKSLDVGDELDLSAALLSWDDLVDWEPGDEAPAGATPTPIPTTTSKARATVRNRHVAEDIRYAHDATHESWTTATPIRWHRVDARGMVGLSTEFERGKDFATVWTTDPALTRAIPRHVVPDGNYTTIHSIHTDWVELLEEDALWRLDRAGESPPEKIGPVPPHFGIVSVVDGQAVYAAVGDGIIRLDRDGKQSRLLTHDLIRSPPGSPMTSYSVLALPDAIAYSRVHFGVSAELMLVHKTSANVEVLCRSERPIQHASRGDTLYWLTHEGGHQLHVLRGGKRTSIRLAHGGSFFSQPDRLYLRVYGDTPSVYSPEGAQLELIGRGVAVPEALDWISIVGDRLFGYPLSGSGPLLAYRLTK